MCSEMGDRATGRRPLQEGKIFKFCFRVNLVQKSDSDWGKAVLWDSAWNSLVNIF